MSETLPLQGCDQVNGHAGLPPALPVALPSGAGKAPPSTRFSSTRQPSRRGTTGPVRSGMMRSTVAGTAIPRGYVDQRKRAARYYTQYVAGVLDSLGSLPRMAMPTLREAGRVAVELETLHHAAEALADSPKRRHELRRLQRRKISLRSQLLALERRIEELAAAQKYLPPSGRALVEQMANGRTPR